MYRKRLIIVPEAGVCDCDGYTQSLRTPTSHSTESRKAKRYRLTFETIIRWLGSDAIVCEAVGTTYDISTCGVFIKTVAPLVVSTTVEVEINLPSILLNTPAPELHFEGTVIRAEKGSSREGVAVAGSLSLKERK